MTMSNPNQTKGIRYRQILNHDLDRDQGQNNVIETSLLTACTDVGMFSRVGHGIGNAEFTPQTKTLINE